MTGDFVDSCEPGKLNEIGEYILLGMEIKVVFLWSSLLMQASGTSPGSSSTLKAS
jgi:hypothetical protein